MPPGAPFTIHPVRTAIDLATAKHLFEAYAATLDIDLSYQNFAAELATLPGPYAPPAGTLLLATATTGEPLGCVALRPLTCTVCEMKRLFVVPTARRLGLGHALIQAAITDAKTLNYRTIRLDTLPTMTAAQTLYAGLGFTKIPPYYETPVPGTIFQELTLPS